MTKLKESRKIFSGLEKFLHEQKVARFNSLAPSGEIHSVPICYAFDSGVFYFHCANPNLKRWKNLKRRSVVSVEVDHYSDDWSQLRGVLVYGTAAFVFGGDEQMRGLSFLKEKYSQYERLPDSTPVVRFQPTSIISWLPKI